MFSALDHRKPLLVVHQLFIYRLLDSRVTARRHCVPSAMNETFSLYSFKPLKRTQENANVAHVSESNLDFLVASRKLNTRDRQRSLFIILTKIVDTKYTIIAACFTFG